jgi:hypothetical protein
MGVMTIAGEVAMNGYGPIIVTVTLETPKGPYTASAAIVEPLFTIEARFDTWSSFFPPFWGDRCGNRPNKVEITAALNGKRLGESDLNFKLNFKHDTIRFGPARYRLRRKIIVGASGITLDAEPRGGTAPERDLQPHADKSPSPDASWGSGRQCARS